MKRRIAWKKLFSGKLYIRISNEYELKLFMDSIPPEYNHSRYRFDYKVNYVYGESEKVNIYGTIHFVKLAVKNTVKFGNDIASKISEECSQYIVEMSKFMTKKEIEESNRHTQENNELERQHELEREDVRKYYTEQREKRKKDEQEREKQILEQREKEKLWEENRRYMAEVSRIKKIQEKEEEEKAWQREKHTKRFPSNYRWWVGHC